MGNTNGSAEKTEDAAQVVSDEVKELGRELRQRAEEAREEVVKQLHNAAEFIRKESKQRDVDPAVKENAQRLAKGLEKSAHYLNSRNIDQLGEDATRVVKRNPWRTMAIIFVVGLIMGVMMRRGD